MSNDNITTTNRQAMLSLIQQAEETGEISTLQQQTQHISANEDRTTIFITQTDGETFDISSTLDVSGTINLNSSDGITYIGADLNVSQGYIDLSTTNENSTESGSLSVSYQAVEFQSADENNSHAISISPTSISIAGNLTGGQATIIKLKSVPSSPSGLAAGTIYRDGSGFLKIV